MHANHLTSHRRSELLLIVALAWAMGLAGCGGPIAFEGKSAFAITGQPPPPPPPPPPPEPEPEPEPPKPPPRVEVRDNQIIIREKIQFEYNKARILEASFGLLDEVAAVIQQNSHIKKIRIEGHASSEGNDDYNLRLSERRASAVMKYLVEHGIPQEALEAKGFGETKPIADNETDEGREKNRRVEFNIIEQEVTKRTVEIDAATGTEKVVTEKQETVKQPAPPAEGQ